MCERADVEWYRCIQFIECVRLMQSKDMVSSTNSISGIVHVEELEQFEVTGACSISF